METGLIIYRILRQLFNPNLGPARHETPAALSALSIPQSTPAKKPNTKSLVPRCLAGLHPNWQSRKVRVHHGELRDRGEIALVSS